MKIHFAITGLLLLASCQLKKEEAIQKKDAYSFYVGTYTNGDSQGIYRYLLQKDGQLKRIGLAAVSDNPSFLAYSSDKRFLLAVNEIDQAGVGTVESYLIAGDSLTLINRSSSGGAHPCFVAVNDVGFVLTANYTGGNVGLLRLDEKGVLSALLDVQQHSGSGNTERQDAPHAHSAWFTPDDKQIISVDLGTNELWFSQIDNNTNKLIPNDPQKLKMPPGAGPRHLTFHPNGKWIYVVNELDCTVMMVQKSNNGSFQNIASVSTLPEGYTEPNTCADIHISSDGAFVYASNRGHNSIAIYDVNNENGSLNLVGHQSTMGDAPRNFSLSPDDHYLLVANQLTDNIVSFRRDKTTGLLKFVHQIEAPTPVCLLF